MSKVIGARIQLKGGTEAEWLQTNPIPYENEIVVVNAGSNVLPNRIKIGNGMSQFSTLPYFDTGQGSFGGFATPPSFTPTTGTQVIWYFVTVPGTFTNVTPTNTGSPLVVPTNNVLGILWFNGTVWSFKTILTTAVNATYSMYVRVKQGGTVGTDCEYTTITDAIDAIGAAATPAFRWKVYVEPGTYNEGGDDGAGIELRHYVDIIGSNRDTVILRGPATTSSCTIDFIANCNIENVTIQAFNQNGCIGSDNWYYGDGATDSVLKSATFRVVNCKLQNFGSSAINPNPGMRYDVNMAIYYNQTIEFTNCEMLGLGIFLGSDDVGQDARFRDRLSSFNFRVEGCTMHNFSYTDYLKYCTDTISLKGNKIDVLFFYANDYAYNGTHGYVQDNIGFPPPLTKIIGYNNEIGFVGYDNTYSTLSNFRKVIMRGYNENGFLTTSVAAGKAVQRLAFSSSPDAIVLSYPFNQFASFVGTGIFAGIADGAIASGTIGCIVTRGTPACYVDTTVNGAVAFGDKLTIDSSGSFVKKIVSTDTTYAIAVSSLSSGLTTQILCRLVGTN